MEPLNIYTKGRWEPLEDFLEQKLEEGKTYNIKVKGICEFMISKDKPTTAGIATNEIKFKKEADLKLWIKTGK